MEDASVKELELYRRGGRWQFSILEDPLGRACGPLGDIGEDATFEEAETALIALVETGYGFTPTPIWREAQPAWWIASIKPER